jgi:hypothetical protein
VITGRVLIDNRPAPEQRVLLISGDMATLLGSTTTDERGEFALTPPANQTSGVLLVKVQGPLLAIAERAADFSEARARSQEFRFVSSGPGFHQLQATIATTADWPPYLRIVVNPVHLAGVSAPLERFFLRRDERIVEESFFHLQLEDRAFALTVQAGSYRIRGDYRLKNRDMMIHPPADDYVVTRVAVGSDGRVTPGNPDAGFVVDVDRDQAVTLTISPISAAAGTPSP